METPMERKLFLKLGRAVGAKGQLLTMFAEVTREEFESGVLSPPLAHGDMDPRVRLFDVNGSKIRPHVMGSFGTVFELEASDSSAKFGTAKFAGQWKNEDDRRRWISEARLVERDVEADKALKKLREHDPLKDTLDELRKVYAATPGFHKRAFIAMVVEYIARG